MLYQPIHIGPNPKFVDIFVKEGGGYTDKSNPLKVIPLSSCITKLGVTPDFMKV